MGISVTPIPRLTTLTTPAFTLGTTNAAGDALTAVASNSTLLAFDGTLPDAITFGQSGAVGSATVSARRDHAHAMENESTEGNLILIGTAVASTSSTLDITGLDSTYDTYLIALQDIVPNTDGNEFYLRVGDSSGIDSGASDYSYSLTMKRPGAADIVNKSTGASSMKLTSTLGNTTGEGLGAAIWLHRPGDGTMDPLLTGSINSVDDGGQFRGGIFFGRRNAVITLDRIQCLSGGAAITSGRMTIFGLAHA